MFEQDITTGPGTGTFASHTMEILIMLLGAFLLGLWLGWVLWNKYKQAYDQLRLDNDALQASVTTLNSELGLLKTKVGALDKEREDLVTKLSISDSENSDLRTKVTTLQSDVNELLNANRQLETALNLNTGEAVSIEENANNSDAPKASADSEMAANLAAITEDDTLLDTESASDSPNVVDLSADTPATTPPDSEPSSPTYEDVSAPTETITVLDDDNFRFVMQAPEEVDALAASARSLTAPAADDDDPFSDHAYEALTGRSAAAPVEDNGQDAAAAPINFMPLKQDDLKIVEGIGPKIEELLFNAGIHTYSELAAAPVTRLKEILNEAGPRFSMHDPGTWSAQALLAANGEWDNLKAYQGFLDSGKAPGKK